MSVKACFYVDNKFFAARKVNNVPSVNDEVRFDRDSFYTVKRKVWCMDTIDLLGELCNIELTKIEILAEVKF